MATSVVQPLQTNLTGTATGNVMNVSGFGSVAIQITGAPGTMVAQVSMAPFGGSPSTWTTVRVVDLNAMTQSTSMTAAGIYMAPVGGFTHFRVNCTGAATAATVTAVATSASIADFLAGTGGGGGSGDGSILDGVSSSIKASVLNYTNSKPVAVRLTDTNGDYIGAGAGTQYTEDAVSAADPVGNMLIVRRRDTPVTNEVSADGDNIALNATNKGELRVNTLQLPGATGTQARSNSLSVVPASDVGDSVSFLSATSYTPPSFQGRAIGAAVIRVLGTFVGTFAVQGSQDGSTTWDAISMHNGTSIVTSATAPGVFYVDLSAWSAVRLICTAYTSGTINVYIGGTSLTQSNQILPLPQGTNTIGGVSNLPTTVDTNSGNKSASTLRVVLATDQPALTSKLLVTPDSVALPANQSVNVSQINAVTPLMGNGTTGTGSQRVTVASDNTPFPVKTDQTTHGTTDLVAADVTKVAGTAVDVNSGNKSAGTLRVVLATDQPALTNKLLVTPDSVALPANQSVNVSQINGVTPLMGAGNTGTGSPRVTIASDQVAIPVTLTTANNTALSDIDIQTSSTSSTLASLARAEDSASANADLGIAAMVIQKATPADTAGTDGDYSPLQMSAGRLWVTNNVDKIAGTAIVNGGVAGSQSIGGTVATNVAITANPVNLGAQAVSSENTAVTTARQVQLVADLVGKQIVLPYANPENFVNTTTAAITDTTSTATLAAAGAGVRNYVTSVIVTNSHATVGTFVKILEGTNIIWEGYAAAAGGGFTQSFPVPLKGAANTAINVQCVTTGANVIASVAGYKGV